MKPWIGAVAVACVAVLAVPGSMVRAVAAPQQAVTQADTGKVTDFGTRRRQYPRYYGYPRSYRPHYRSNYRSSPHYYARPYYYQPYPYYTPFPFIFGFGFGPR
jgi:hypothetical protein